MQPMTALVLDRILAFVAPLFLAQSGGDLRLARVAGAKVLQSNGARTDQELHLAALIIAFSERALDALARAAEPGLDLRAVLRLNTSATALSRAAFRCQKELDKLRTQGPAEPPAPIDLPVVDPADLAQQTSARPHPEHGLSAGNESDIEPINRSAGTPLFTPHAACTLSRQQRRAAERLAAKQHRRQGRGTRQMGQADPSAVQARQAA